MMSRILALAAFIPFLLLSSVSLAQAQATIVTTDEASDDDFVETLEEPIVLPAPPFEEGASDSSTLADGETGIGIDITEITNADDPSTSTGRATSAEAQRFRAQLNQHTIDVLKWQLRTSERILQLVMFMSLAGILFAGYQLWHSLNVRTKRAAAASDSSDGAASATASNTDSTISFGDGKFEVTSPIVGILILVISLGALYFFLDFVYTVKVVSVAAG